MAICDNLYAIRRQKGLTQKQVARACGLADSTIRTYEAGNANPKPATVAKLAKALGVTPAELYGVDWIPGLPDTPDPEVNAALYASMLNDPLPVDKPNKARLMASFDKLNSAGQQEATKRIEEMTQVHEYQATPADDPKHTATAAQPAIGTQNDAPIFSIDDLINTYTSYDASDEAKEPILSFLSDLTGKSVDALMEIL